MSERNARMLRQMGADRKDKRVFSKLPQAAKPIIRAFHNARAAAHEASGKMSVHIHYSLPRTLAASGLWVRR